MSYIESADDLNKKYHNCYVKYQEDVGLISHFGMKSDGSIQCVWRTASMQEAVKLDLDPNGIEAFSFNSTFINNSTLLSEKDVNCAAVHVSRSPKRQWKRGICPENTWLRCPAEPLYKAYGKRVQWNNQLSFALIERLMEPTFPTLERAVKKCDHFISVAISPMFAITLSNISNEKYLLTSPFGFIGEADAKHLWVRHPPALQEVQDFVNRTNQLISVELV